MSIEKDPRSLLEHHFRETAPKKPPRLLDAERDAKLVERIKTEIKDKAAEEITTQINTMVEYGRLVTSIDTPRADGKPYTNEDLIIFAAAREDAAERMKDARDALAKKAESVFDKYGMSGIVPFGEYVSPPHKVFKSSKPQELVSGMDILEQITDESAAIAEGILLQQDLAREKNAPAQQESDTVEVPRIPSAPVGGMRPGRGRR